TGGQGGSAAAGVSGQGVSGDDGGTYAWGGPIGYAKGGDTDDDTRDDLRDDRGLETTGFEPITAFGEPDSLKPSSAVVAPGVAPPALRGGSSGGGGGGDNTLGTIMSIAGTAAKFLPMLSDRRAKTDIQHAGHDDSGLPLYAYRYKGDPKTYPKVVGPMYQDVKKRQGYAEGGSTYERMMARPLGDPRVQSAGEDRYLQALESLRQDMNPPYRRAQLPGAMNQLSDMMPPSAGSYGAPSWADDSRLMSQRMMGMPRSRNIIDRRGAMPMPDAAQPSFYGFARGGYPDFFNAPPMPVPGMPQRTAFAGRGYVHSDGQGDGRSDHIDAALSPGEFVVDAETTSMLGDGDNSAGARKLETMRQNIRRHKGAALAKGKFSPAAKQPEQYLSSKLSASDRLAHSGISDGLRGRRK
ncbi:MAG TPA: tail fiber domain-containing protein, partial [Reyranella sp.]|nr:tail fiber domain-containing protein [Reyranella sp.]